MKKKSNKETREIRQKWMYKNTESDKQPREKYQKSKIYIQNRVQTQYSTFEYTEMMSKCKHYTT